MGRVRKKTTLTTAGKKFQNSRGVIFSRPNFESGTSQETAVVKYNEEEDFYYLESDVFEQVGWKPGDDITWTIDDDGWITLKKEEKNMSYQNDVTEFMSAADQYVGKTPHLNEDNMAQARLYIDLIDEEFRELCDGFLRRHIGDIADGGADLVWVVKGLFTTLGIDFDKVWEEVRASNMSKVSEGGKIKKRADGKILKPDTYFKPDIDRVLKEQGL